ncbi:MAG: hypothetical protein ACYC1M_16625 [Armatimonadota bacterium]
MYNPDKCYMALCDVVAGLPAKFLLRVMPGFELRISVDGHDFYYVFTGIQPHAETVEDFDKQTHIDTGWFLKDCGHEDIGGLSTEPGRQIISCSKIIEANVLPGHFGFSADFKKDSDRMHHRVHNASIHLLKSIPMQTLTMITSPVVLQYPMRQYYDARLFLGYLLHSQWDICWVPDTNKPKYQIITYTLDRVANTLIEYHESSGALSQ